ncbi:MAG: hypothetical protein JW794_02370 [Candidatus Cloacimonetes bacterium]|nr:hypothetical protein [Candidatus Cloacimonadota bacterium]
MKKKYFVHKERLASGEHEVHSEDCSWMASEEERIYLGEYYCCKPAIEEAKKHYFQVNGCYACCNECHKD